jgi:hypothetical protein
LTVAAGAEELEVPELVAAPVMDRDAAADADALALADTLASGPRSGHKGSERAYADERT